MNERTPRSSRLLAGALGALTALAAEGCNCCISAEARVLTPSGRRRLGDLADGDLVIVVDPKSGERVSSRIKVVATAVRPVGTLELVDGRTLALTSDHPLWSPVKKEWLPAEEWFSGRLSQVSVVDEDGVKSMEVRSVTPASKDARVVDISVEAEASCFVANGVIVHNKSEDYGCTDTPCVTSISPSSEDSGGTTDTGTESTDSGE